MWKGHRPPVTPLNFYTTWYCLNCIYRLLELFHSEEILFLFTQISSHVTRLVWSVTHSEGRGFLVTDSQACCWSCSTVTVARSWLTLRLVSFVVKERSVTNHTHPGGKTQSPVVCRWLSTVRTCHSFSSLPWVVWLFSRKKDSSTPVRTTHNRGLSGSSVTQHPVDRQSR